MKPTSSLWTIAKKEFFSYINSPVAYIVLVPFLIISSFLFFRSALIINDANLRPYIELLPWFLMIIGPALTMRAFADEKRKDISELLFAHPVSEWTVVVGKFFGILMFYALMLLATIPLPISLLFFSNPDIGVFLGQYIGMLAVGSIFLVTGLAASAIIGNVVGSFLTAVAINFTLILIGMNFVVLLFPGFIGRIVNEFAVTPHVNSISRGVLDLRDLLYFATIVMVFLALTVIKLSERKVAELNQEKRRLWTVMGLILAIGIAGNVLMLEFPIRFDLTASHQYSISGGTHKLLSQLPDRVTISLYTSQNLPGSMQITLRETSDWLKDFKRLGKKIALRTINTDAKPEHKQEALQRGMREVQFNQIGSNSFQVQTGILGLEVRYGDKTEVIDFIEDGSNLEYQLSRMILKLTQENTPKIGIISAVTNVADTKFNTMLSGQYSLTPITDSSTSDEVMSVSGIVAIDDGTTSNATPAAILRQYLNNGGNAAIFIDGVSVSTRNLQPVNSTSNIISVLKDYGIDIKPTLTYDWQLNESVTLGQGSVRYIMPYPFWIRALLQPNALPSTKSINNVLLGWASSINATANNGWTIKPLLKTSKAGGVQEGNFTVDPNSLKSLAKATGEQVIGVVAEKEAQRLVVVADADLVGDEFILNSPENQTFTANIVDLVAANPILNQIPRRTSSRNVFRFTSNTQAKILQYANIASPALITTCFGIWWLWRRRQLSKRVK